MLRLGLYFSRISESFLLEKQRLRSALLLG
jgi:hypothetical protein